METQVNQSNKKGLARKIFVILLVLLVGAGAGFGIFYFLSKNKPVKPYNAVLLDNGNMYFGKVSSEKKMYVKLSDIYYLKVNPASQTAENKTGEAGPPAGEAGKKAENKNASAPDISLMKMGAELYGPEDEMKILREHVVFIQKLAPNSKVVETIKKQKEGQK